MAHRQNEHRVGIIDLEVADEAASILFAWENSIQTDLYLIARHVLPSTREQVAEAVRVDYLAKCQAVRAKLYLIGKEFNPSHERRVTKKVRSRQ